MANIFEIEKKNGEIFIEHFKMWNAWSIRAYNFNHRAQLLRFVSIAISLPEILYPVLLSCPNETATSLPHRWIETFVVWHSTRSPVILIEGERDPRFKCIIFFDTCTTRCSIDSRILGRGRSHLRIVPIGSDNTRTKCAPRSTALKLPPIFLSRPREKLENRGAKSVSKRACAEMYNMPPSFPPCTMVLC